MMKNKVHYAWVICVACALMMFLTYGVLANVFTVYVPSIVSENNFSYAHGTNLATIRNLSALFFSLTVNFFISKLGVKRLCLVSVFIMVISRGLFATGGSYIVYVIATVLAGASYIFSGIVPTSILIGNWFKSSRNLALGITSAGTGLANIFLSPLVTKSLFVFGLKLTFIFEGILLLAFGLFIVYLLKATPEEMGLSPYTNGQEEVASKNITRDEPSISNIRWYLVLFACFLTASPASSGFLNLTVLMDSQGYESNTIGWLISFLGIALIVGKLTMGRLYDVLGSFKANFITGGCASLAMFIFATFLNGKNIVFPVLGISLLGFGVMFSTITQPIWGRDLMGNNAFNKAISRLNFAFTSGSVFHNLLASLIVSVTGSYVPAYYLSLVLTIIAVTIVQIIYFGAKKYKTTT